MGCAARGGKSALAVHKRATAMRGDGAAHIKPPFLMIFATDLMPPTSPPILAAIAIALAGLLAGCGEGQKQAAPPPPKVTVAKPAQRTIVDQDEYVGRFVPVNVVEVRARVSGYLDQIHFTDGQIVQQGDLLFTIDKRPFENALEQAKANLTQAKANLAFTEADLDRGSQLVRDKTITQQTFD